MRTHCILSCLMRPSSYKLQQPKTYHIKTSVLADMILNQTRRFRFQNRTLIGSNRFQLTCDTIVAQAAPAIPYPRKVHKTTSPTPFIALATANAFRGPHESFIPRLRQKQKQKAGKNVTPE